MMKSKFFIWSLVAALSGLLFGFDTAVISGADKSVQEQWGLSDLNHGIFIMSVALWGTVLGALLGGIPCDRLGRRKTLIWVGILYFFSALGSACAWSPLSFSMFRLIGGIGVGVSSIAAPAYISEISPSERRGRLVIMYQLSIVFGMLIAFASNYFFEFLGDGAWRWMLGAEVLPAGLYLIFVFGISESPRWLVLFRNDEVAARKVLGKIYPSEHVDEALKRIHDSWADSQSKMALFVPRFRKPIMLAVLLAFFNQISGINFVIYYAPRIFESAGFASSTALLSTTGIGAVGIVVTMAGLYLIDRAGRKKLLIIGSIGYIFSLVMLSLTFYREDFDGLAVPGYIFLFVASHGIGQGSVIWVFISEIFPNSVRGKGQALGSGTHWILAATITLIMPVILGRFSGGPVFAFFAFMMLLQFFWTIIYVPETKGVSLEDLEKRMME